MQVQVETLLKLRLDELNQRIDRLEQGSIGTGAVSSDTSGRQQELHAQKTVQSWHFDEDVNIKTSYQIDSSEKVVAVDKGVTYSINKQSSKDMAGCDELSEVTTTIGSEASGTLE